LQPNFKAEKLLKHLGVIRLAFFIAIATYLCKKNIALYMIDFTTLRIVFMGTPEFAVESLAAMVNAGCNVVGVITAPDKPAGRGMQLQQSPVKLYALANNLTVLQPEKLKNENFLQQLKALHADVQVVVAFRMLPEVVWNMPPMGTINVHGSLLPNYRGAAPINWAVINGDTQTGVTTFKLQHQIDTGDILLQKSFAIGPNDTATKVHDVMKVVGANLLLETLKGIANQTIVAQPQQTSQNTIHAPKIFTETCAIDFGKPANQVHNLIRGLANYPGAFTMLQNKKFKIFGSAVVQQNHTSPAGTIETDGKTYFYFCCAQNKIAVTNAQLEGKKRMPITEFLRGFKM
jgi:methionyl-tRNA formyltransferase